VGKVVDEEVDGSRFGVETVHEKLLPSLLDRLGVIQSEHKRIPRWGE